MAWTEIQQLRTLRTHEGDRLLDFVPHSVNHVYFDKLSADQIRFEITDSRRMLEERLAISKCAIQFFCFPGGIGEGKPDIQSLLYEAGYTGALRAHAVKNHGWSRYSIPRCEPSNIHQLKRLLENVNTFECN